MATSSRRGLVWDDSGLDSEPCWHTEPELETIKAVCLRTLEINIPDECEVKYMTAGSFNKLYLVELKENKKLIMRVSLSVDPRYKTSGEVTTLRWIRQHTTIPVPEVIAFDDTCNNEIGFEWILMEFMPGRSAYSLWRKIPMAAKEVLAEQIADYQNQLFKASQETPMLRGIGTLMKAPGKDCHPMPSRIVSRLFFWGPRFDYDIPRGPFRSSYDWLDACIRIIIHEQHDALNKAENKGEREDAEHHIRVAEKLRGLLPKIFPAVLSVPERTVIWHDDFSLNNILVDDQGSITAVIDWEFVSAVPYWAATEMPQLLAGPEREGKPNRDGYANESPECAQAGHGALYDDELDNEGKDELYWIHLMEYEQTQLRKAYSDRMRHLQPTWDADVAESNLKVDFLGAVDRCAYGWFLKLLDKWVDMVNKGEFHRLGDVLDPTITLN